METTMEQSLSQVIEPLLAPTDHDPAAGPDLEPSQRRMRYKRSRIVPGSEADYRRKEANRLAAERSRARAHEKAVAIETAAQAAAEENSRLKAEIARLEGETGRGHGQGHGDPSQTIGQVEGLGQADQKSGQGQGHGETGQLHEDGPTAEQNDAHSRNILAALMSDAGITGVEDGDEATWMQGVENFIKEAESSGRLGELAAVAAGQNEGEADSGHDGAVGGGEGQLQSPAAEATDGSPGAAEISHDVSLVEAPVKRELGFTSAGAMSATASAIAVALNTEMERILRDDLASTKAAIAWTAREMARLKGELPLDDISDPVPHAPLPADFLATDEVALKESVTSSQKSVASLEEELPVYREVVICLRDDKIEDEVKLAKVVGELHSVSFEAEEKEREEIVGVLKNIGGYVGTLVNGLYAGAIGSGTGALSNAFSSPAIARRKRGRPPKGSQPLSYAQNLVYSLSPSRTSPNGIGEASAPEASAKPKARRGRPPRKSRLSQLVQSASESQDQGGEAANAHEEEVGSSSRTMEEAILSHLQQQVDARDAEGEEMHLDPASFAELLPPHLDNQFGETDGQHDAGNSEGEQQQQQQEQSRALIESRSQFQSREAAASRHPRHDTQSAVDMSTSTAGEAEEEASGQDAVTAAGGSSSTIDSPSVISRLRKGPPGSCDLCWRTETPSWRKITLGGETYKVCNPCGVYWRKCKVLRPPELWGDGKTVKKRRTGARGSMAMDEEGMRKRKKDDLVAEGVDVGIEAEAEANLVREVSQHIDPSAMEMAANPLGGTGPSNGQREGIPLDPALQVDEHHLPEEMHLEGESLRSVFGV